METNDPRAVLRQAIAEITRLRATVDELKAQQDAPIALVGIGCRFPGGACDAASYWRMLCDGTDAISEVPRDRWAAEAFPASRWGGFLGDVDQFDAAFFGISPREAADMDPRQRVLLEVCVEAVEDAGCTRDALAGSLTAVFVGAYNHDYLELQTRFGDASRLGPYTGTGNSHSILAGRVAYALDLRGPCVTLDTACSSSLAAIHYACQALRRRECDLALAGGVNLLLSPLFGVVTASMGMMAADGRCKSFDARADGFVRGEGCGMLVLKRLADAVAARDRIYAVVRGSAVNQDGRTNGLTAPNGLAQRAVIRAALRDAGAAAAEVGYVEAHGTGTALGDPIEWEALTAELDSPDRTSPCVVGAVKSNLGHLEAAAGVAGLIKAALCLQQRVIPPNLHLQRPNSRLARLGFPLALADRLRAWDGPALAGVSAFGWSGTNVHVVLDRGPEPSLGAPDLRVYPLLVTANSHDGLRCQAERYATALDAVANGSGLTHESFANMCYSSALRRTHHPWRLGVAAESAADAAAALRRAATSVASRQPADAARIVFVFPGQGGHWRGMAEALLREEPVFREAVEPLAFLQAWNGSDASDLVQPALFAMQVGLAALWRSWGVEPTAVIGHSMGEVAAAHVAGILDLRDAAQLIQVRSRLLHSQRGHGAMALLALGKAEAVRKIAEVADDLSIAAVNSPRTTIVAGPAESVHGLLQSCEADGVFARWLQVEAASHCSQVDALVPELMASLRGLEPRVGHVRMESTAFERTVDGRDLDAAYWAANLRNTVKFEAAVQRLASQGPLVFLEMSPHPLLVAAIEECGAPALPSMRRDVAPGQVLVHSLTELFAAGVAINWQPLFATTCHNASLPGTAWQRKSYWFVDRASAEARYQPPAADASGSMYALQWRESPLPAAEASPSPRWSRAWYLVPDQDRATTALEASIRRSGGWVLSRPADGQGVAYLANDDERDASDVCASFLSFLQSLLAVGWETPPQLCVVTRAGCLGQSALAGMVRVLAHEHAQLRPRFIQFDGNTEELCAELRDGAHDAEVVLRDGKRFAAGLARVDVRPLRALSFRADATYLISGGLGGLGVRVGQWMVDRGAGRVVLVSRHGPSGAVAEAIASAGGRLVAGCADVADYTTMASVFGEIARSGRPLAGIVHAAAVLDDGVLTELDVRRLARVMRPKVDGAWTLHRLSEGLPLDFFVLFSSAAAVLGLPGQANYAAANAYLDALASYRAQQGLPALSIAWGPWTEVGLAAADPRRGERLASRGLAGFTPEQGLAVLGELLVGDQTTVAAMKWDARRWSSYYGVALDADTQATPRPPSLLEMLTRAPLGDRQDLLEKALRLELGTILRRDPSELDPKAPLRALGVDSLLALELRNRLERLCQLTLPATLVWRCPTSSAVAAYVAQRMGIALSAEPDNAVVVSKTESVVG